MQPPAGRITIGQRVEVPGGRRGRVVAERLIATNGAWFYTIALDDGGNAEHLDFELRPVEA
ncbi:MAG: hypothetical protein E6J71_18050 [Deltaproteobacteria bacterium]|jgi:hypothetical protein|nr:MAG: hypothetical protein E6J81_06990 [Deltaproteobacteria bacterium]TMA49914.1 MAG: hypothetical protein E6J76_12660 [Deltaproteobacteria bacterium]TMB15786.1 MAG: hypothetical protein E6J71_18050 [Deltaproteobacteria bacterium]